MWIQGTSPPASRPGLAQILLEKIGLLAPDDGSDQGLIYLAVEVSFLTVGCVLVVIVAIYLVYRFSHQMVQCCRPDPMSQTSRLLGRYRDESPSIPSNASRHSGFRARIRRLPSFYGRPSCPPAVPRRMNSFLGGGSEDEAEQEATPRPPQQLYRPQTQQLTPAWEEQYQVPYRSRPEVQIQIPPAAPEVQIPIAPAAPEVQVPTIPAAQEVQAMISPNPFAQLATGGTPAALTPSGPIPPRRSGVRLRNPEASLSFAEQIRLAQGRMVTRSMEAEDD